MNIRTLSLCALFVSSIACLATKDNWTKVPTEEQEYQLLVQECAKIRARIKEQFTAFNGSGTRNSSGSRGAIDDAIFQFLKRVGTPVSLRLAKELIQSGQLPKIFLNYI